MNFLEKNLEDIIWENYERCAERGLDIAQGFYKNGERFRQLNLMPYGIADIVCACYSPSEKAYWFQVIELKRGKIDASAYMQAKRYQTALRSAFEANVKKLDAKAVIYVESVLIGDEIEINGDFTFALNNDPSCAAFTYSYGFDGISFTRDSKEWVVKGWRDSSSLKSVAAQLLDIGLQAQVKYAHTVAEELRRQKQSDLEYGDYNQPLLITANGVEVNGDLVDMDYFISRNVMEANWALDAEEEEGGEDGNA